MPSLNPSGAPVETKVVAQAGYGWLTGLVTWILLTVFHVTLPASLTAYLPVVVGSVCGAVAGWMAKHTPRLEEVVQQVEALVGQGAPVTRPASSPPVPIAQAPTMPAGPAPIEPPAGTVIASAQGIDKSNHNPPGGFAGFDFGFCKATEGLTFRDGTFAQNWSDLARLGIPRGAYHFLRLTDDGAAQARYFFATVKAHGLRTGDMLVVDSEIAGANADAVTHAFLAELRQLTAGLRCILLTYTDLSVGATLHRTAAAFPNLWIAYPSSRAPASVAPWPTWQFWQWGQRGVDRDAFNGTAADLAAWIRQHSTAGSGSDWQEAMMRKLPVLRQGATGPDVRSVQGLCEARGHSVGPSGIDGIFGAHTTAAVKAVQRAAKINDDGIVGPVTWPVLLHV